MPDAAHGHGNPEHCLVRLGERSDHQGVPERPGFRPRGQVWRSEWLGCYPHIGPDTLGLMLLNAGAEIPTSKQETEPKAFLVCMSLDDLERDTSSTMCTHP